MRVRLVWLLFVLAGALTPQIQAAEADALSIEKNIVARHLPFGTVVDPIFASPTSDVISFYTRCGDSAIWTGHFLAAEAFHYKATGSADALANVKTAIAGLKLLVDVTGTNLLARCAVPVSSPYNAGITSEERGNGIYQNTSLGYSWVGNTSRDQYSGAFFGLSVAYEQVNDTVVRNSIRDLGTRMLDFLRSQNWIVTMPDGSPSTTFIGRGDQQLAFLQIGRQINPDRFSTAYDVNRFLLGAAVFAPIALETTSDSSYFKFNLDYINLYSLIRIEGDGLASDIYAPAYSALRSHTDGHQNPFFNMIDRALTGMNAGRDADTIRFLDQWLQRPRRDLAVDLRGKLPSCGDADTACNPIPIPQRVPTDFLWQRSPFQLSGGGSGLIESAGIDYILPYWMARVYGVISTSALLSAASGSNLIAPESLVAFYGTNLSPATATATTLPLPTSLGGITVQVRDSAGVSRLAPLFYVSPTQVNFEIPAGTAAGAAVVTITNGGPMLNITVQAVAPALFTANANGSGVPAATAARIGVNGIQSPVPVFQCTAQGLCTPVPIPLGVDTPVYLTLYGTGIRNRAALGDVTVTIKGIGLPVLYAGPQGTYVGLDQVNLLLPLSLRNSGETDLVLSVKGQPSNTVRINVQ